MLPKIHQKLPQRSTLGGRNVMAGFAFCHLEMEATPHFSPTLQCCYLPVYIHSFSKFMSWLFNCWYRKNEIFVHILMTTLSLVMRLYETIFIDPKKVTKGRLFLFCPSKELTFLIIFFLWVSFCSVWTLQSRGNWYSSLGGSHAW